jgi:hypothetical protein
MNAYRAIVGLAVFMAILAAGLFFWPVKTHLSPFDPVAVSETSEKASLAPFAAKFDLARLPERQMPEPPAIPKPVRDPAMELRRYRFIGLAASEARAAGVFERDGRTIVLTPGKALEGFSLSSVDSGTAHFKDENGNEARLSLEKAPLE